MGQPRETPMLAWAHSQHSEQGSAGWREGVGDCFRECRQFVGRVPIDKQNFVILAEQLGKTIQAERRALVQIIAVHVIAAMNHYRDQFGPTALVRLL